MSNDAAERLRNEGHLGHRYDSLGRLTEAYRLLDEALAVERRDTVERIRAAVREMGWELDSPWLASILEAEAQR